MYMRILNNPNDHSYLFGAVCELRLMSYSLDSKDASYSHLVTSGASVRVFWAWHNIQATPGLLDACITGCDEFATTCEQAQIRL